MNKIIKCAVLCGLALGPLLAAAAEQYSFRPLEEEANANPPPPAAPPAPGYGFSAGMGGGASLYSGPPHEQNNVVYQGYRFRTANEEGMMAGERPAPLEQAPTVTQAQTQSPGGPIPPGYYQPTAMMGDQQPHVASVPEGTRAAGHQFRTMPPMPVQGNGTLAGQTYPPYGGVPTQTVPGRPAW